MSVLERALTRGQNRIAAVFNADPDTIDDLVALVDDEALAQIVSGFGLDQDELRTYCINATHGIVIDIAEGRTDVRTGLAGHFVSGLIIGLMVAEEAREEVRQ